LSVVTVETRIRLLLSLVATTIVLVYTHVQVI